jgi:hypothetical protein
MITDTDDYSWEQVYGLMRCSTKFEGATENCEENDCFEIEYFDPINN